MTQLRQEFISALISDYYKLRLTTIINPGRGTAV